jgi:formiminoglutamase
VTATLKSFDDIRDFLSPPDPILSGQVKSYHPNQLFSRIDFLPEQLPDLANCVRGIALVGVMEARGKNPDAEIDLTPDLIRSRLFRLFAHQEMPIMVDLGNINPGFDLQDTQFALSRVIALLAKKGWTVVVLGGSHDLTYGTYLAFEHLEQMVNLACIDASVDLGESPLDTPAKSFLSQIILHQPNYLFNLTQIAYQTYFVDPDVLNLLGKLFFDAYRLGQVRGNAEFVEPLLRNADIVSIDFKAIRGSDIPGVQGISPNGLAAEEICQMSKYAGASDKVTVFGIFDALHADAEVDASVMLAAQMIWSFIDGFIYRWGEIPGDHDEDFMKYRVSLLNSSHEIVFYKSLKTDRWWMQVPYPPDKRAKYERHHLVACSYQDYLYATSNGMPDRWWQTFQKLV